MISSLTIDQCECHAISGDKGWKEGALIYHFLWSHEAYPFNDEWLVVHGRREALQFDFQGKKENIWPYKTYNNKNRDLGAWEYYNGKRNISLLIVDVPVHDPNKVYKHRYSTKHSTVLLRGENLDKFLHVFDP